MRKYFICLFVIAAFTGCDQPLEEKVYIRPVKAIRVSDPSLIRSRPFPGVIRAENRVNLSFRVDGPLVEFPVDVGDNVEEGQILAKIDPQDFQVNLEKAEANLERAKAAFSFSESDYKRAESIQKEDPGAISQSMVDRKREDQNSKRADVKSFASQMDAAKNQLEYTHLRAPFEGVVVATYVENFEFVRAKQSVVRMLDSSRIEMVVDIPEHMISYIPRIKQVTVHLDTFPDRDFEAKVKEIGTEASTTTRTYPVTLVLWQPEDIQLLSGMSGEAKFVGKVKDNQEQNEITIPITAVFSPQEKERSFLWVIDPDTRKVSLREVALGRVVGEGILIREGLLPGEWIATAGVHYLTEGQEVLIEDFTENP